METIQFRVIKFHKDFYCIGFDKTKVANGIEDNREMRDIDKTKEWNKGTKVCMKMFYHQTGYTKKQIQSMNKNIWDIPVLL
jgi:hypothetical protein